MKGQFASLLDLRRIQLSNTVRRCTLASSYEREEHGSSITFFPMIRTLSLFFLFRFLPSLKSYRFPDTAVRQVPSPNAPSPFNRDHSQSSAPAVRGLVPLRKNALLEKERKILPPLPFCARAYDLRGFPRVSFFKGASVCTGYAHSSFRKRKKKISRRVRARGDGRGHIREETFHCASTSKLQ